MRRNKRLISLLLVSQLLVWFVGNAQTDPFENLPDGFPIGDVSYVGDNSYTSPTFGDFQLDPSIHNRVIHGVLGPFVWEWNETTKVVTLNSEWWGPLETCLPSDAATAGLGFSFPYIRNKYTGIIFLVDPTGSTSTPFGKLDANNSLVGWQSAIGVNLNDAGSNFLGAQTMVSQMQAQVQSMLVARDNLAGYTVKLGDSGFQHYRELAIQHMATVNELYGRFLFYRLRTILAPQWVVNMGGDEAAVQEAQGHVANIPGLEQLAVGVYQDAHHILFNVIEPMYGAKLQQLATLQAAQNPQNSNGGGSSGGSSGGGSSGGSSGGGDGSGSSTPEVKEGDVISWSMIDIVGRPAQYISKDAQVFKNFRRTAKLTEMRPYKTGGKWRLKISQSGAEKWPQYPQSTGKLTAGNLWIFVPQGNGRYWGTSFEGYDGSRTDSSASNLNFEHTNILQGTPIKAPWQPKSGVKYGWMISTLVNGKGPSAEQRTNIIFQNWP